MIIRDLTIRPLGYLVRAYYSKNPKSIKPNVRIQPRNTWANLIISVKVNFFMRQLWIVIYKA